MNITSLVWLLSEFDKCRWTASYPACYQSNKYKLIPWSYQVSPAVVQVKYPWAGDNTPVKYISKSMLNETYCFKVCMVISSAQLSMHCTSFYFTQSYDKWIVFFSTLIIIFFTNVENWKDLRKCCPSIRNRWTSMIPSVISRNFAFWLIDCVLVPHAELYYTTILRNGNVWWMLNAKKKQTTVLI